jgi:NTP pyrophosphatase (non-canonical NTP hydrolase)
LVDCLWSVLILAHRYEIDLQAAFDRTMDELDRAITRRLAAKTGGTDDDESSNAVIDRGHVD